MTHEMTRLIIQRHGVPRGWGAGLNNLHLECIRLLGFIFFYLFYTVGNSCWSSGLAQNPTREVEMAFRFLGIWVDGGNLHAKKMATGYLRFAFWFPSLLFPCCSSIQNLCDYQTCDLAVRHSERLSLVFFFFFSLLF